MVELGSVCQPNRQKILPLILPHEFYCQPKKHPLRKKDLSYQTTKSSSKRCITTQMRLHIVNNPAVWNTTRDAAEKKKHSLLPICDKTNDNQSAVSMSTYSVKDNEKVETQNTIVEVSQLYQLVNEIKTILESTTMDNLNQGKEFVNKVSIIYNISSEIKLGKNSFNFTFV